MAVSKLPSGRWRAQVYDPARGHNRSVGDVLGTPGITYAKKAEAQAALAEARKILGSQPELVTIGDWYQRWTTDPLFRRPKASTNKHNHERVKAFCERHASIRVHVLGTARGDQIVSEWLTGARRNSQVPALRAMVNDAMSAKGGRLCARNPFAGLGLAKTKGNAEVDPPSEDVVWALIRSAQRLAVPSFAAWLQVAAFTGLRPGELDALRHENVDLGRGVIHVVEQFSAATGTFTSPKNGRRREAPLTPPAREALLGMPRDASRSPFVFTNQAGSHWTPSARAYHWKAVAASVGYEGSLYLATRHFAGWFMTNVLMLPAEDVAIALGHTDGGYLVRTLYGHRSKDDALRRVQNAYEQRANVRPLGIVRDDRGG